MHSTCAAWPAGLAGSVAEVFPYVLPGGAPGISQRSTMLNFHQASAAFFPQRLIAVQFPSAVPRGGWSRCRKLPSLPPMPDGIWTPRHRGRSAPAPRRAPPPCSTAARLALSCTMICCVAVSSL